MIYKLNKVTGYKINIEVTVAIQYTMNLLKKIKRKIPFTTVTKIKIFRNKFNQGSESSLKQKVINIKEKNYRGHKNEKIYHVHGSKESILIK
jgi:hypothetical protein